MPFREAHGPGEPDLRDLPDTREEHGVTLNGMLAKKNAFGGTAPERVKEAAKAALERLQ